MRPHRHPPIVNAQRRRWLGAGAAGLLVTAWPAATLATPAARVLVEVWKDPSCGCCGDWILHLQANGLAVKVNDTGNTAMRRRLGIDLKYGSCHTALVGGYAIEGHVPAREIHRLLKERPAALGLAVPGMPVGSPGMDGDAYGGRKDPYDVLLLARDGGARVFQAYR
ncbi:MAG: DUF411 domain-containing protein [Rubrivivax sp.]|nr:DUF411 domain-containing protein [Rubrivivax sp.]